MSGCKQFKIKLKPGAIAVSAAIAPCYISLSCSYCRQNWGSVNADQRWSAARWSTDILTKIQSLGSAQALPEAID